MKLKVENKISAKIYLFEFVNKHNLLESLIFAHCTQDSQLIAPNKKNPYHLSACMHLYNHLFRYDPNIPNLDSNLGCTGPWVNGHEIDKQRVRPGESLFVSCRKYFPSRVALDVPGDVTGRMRITLFTRSLGSFFLHITDHYRSQKSKWRQHKFQNQDQ